MEPIIITLFLVGLGVASFLGVHWSAAEKIKRALRAARRYSIADLPEDTSGRVVGTVRILGEPLVAPLSERLCVYYVVEVTEGIGKHKKAIIREERAVPFVLEDETGRALVDADGAMVALKLDSYSASGGSDRATSREEALLARHRTTSTAGRGNRSLEYEEGVIAVGETISVLGSAVREPDPDAPRGEGYRDAPPTRLRFTSSKKLPLHISDDVLTTT